MLTTSRPAERQAFSTLLEINDALAPYFEAARHGTTSGLRAMFHDDARISGWIDGKMLSLDPDVFVAWVEANGPSPDVAYRIASIDYSGAAATVRIEFQDWLHFRFTDFFTLARDTGGWRVTSKVYDAHGRAAAPVDASEALGEQTAFVEAKEIAAVIDAYIDGARSGDAQRLRSIWFDEARIIGRFGGDMVNRSADDFCAAVAGGGGAPGVKAQLVAIDRSGAAASARLELSDWKGVRYTDFFSLMKLPESWRITGKVFDAHDRA